MEETIKFGYDVITGGESNTGTTQNTPSKNANPPSNNAGNTGSPNGNETTGDLQSPEPRLIRHQMNYRQTEQSLVQVKHL